MSHRSCRRMPRHRLAGAIVLKFALILCTVIVCLLNAALVRAADRKQLSAALAAVEANLKTPAGKQYDEHFGKQLVQQHSAPMKQCKQSAPSGILDPFDLFLKLRL